MDNGWRPQATVAIASFALIPLWMMAASTLKGTGGSDELGIAMVAPCLIFAVGIGVQSQEFVAVAVRAEWHRRYAYSCGFFCLSPWLYRCSGLANSGSRSQQPIGRTVPRNESCPLRQHLVRLSLHDGSGNEVVD